MTLTETLKDLSNQNENLGFTSKKLNKIKFSAVYEFAEDYKKEPTTVNEFVYYLNAQKEGRVDGWRKAVTIEKEMVNSYDYLTNQLRCEDRLEEAISNQLHDMFINGMKLK